MLVFKNSDTEFIKKNLPADSQEKIFSAQETNTVLDILSEWIDLSEECWEENGEDYSELGRQAQRIYDNIYLNN
jgi:hypothetical protein